MQLAITFLVAIATVEMHITPRNGLFTWRNSIIEPPRNGLYAWRNSIIITPRNGLYTSRSSIICVHLLNDGISLSEWFLLIDGIFPCCKSIIIDGISVLLWNLRCYSICRIAHDTINMVSNEKRWWPIKGHYDQSEDNMNNERTLWPIGGHDD